MVSRLNQAACFWLSCVDFGLYAISSLESKLLSYEQFWDVAGATCTSLEWIIFACCTSYIWHSDWFEHWQQRWFSLPVVHYKLNLMPIFCRWITWIKDESCVSETRLAFDPVTAEAMAVRNGNQLALDNCPFFILIFFLFWLHRPWEKF